MAHKIEKNTVNKILCFVYFQSHISGYFHMRTKQRKETKTLFGTEKSENIIKSFNAIRFI